MEKNRHNVLGGAVNEFGRVACPSDAVVPVLQEFGGIARPSVAFEPVVQVQNRKMQNQKHGNA